MILALFGRHARAALKRRLFEKAFGDLARRAAADRGDAGDREKILDEGARALLVGPLENAEHAAMIAPRRRSRAASRIAAIDLPWHMAARDAAAPFAARDRARKQP